MATYAQQASSGKNNSGPGNPSGNSSTSNNGSHHHHHHHHQNSNMSSTSNANNNQPHDKKEEFRKYLEQTGVLDSLTKALVGLYEEPQRPANAIEYVQRYMGAPQNVDVDGMRRENEQLKLEVERLRSMAGMKSKGSGGAGNK